MCLHHFTGFNFVFTFFTTFLKLLGIVATSYRKVPRKTLIPYYFQEQC